MRDTQMKVVITIIGPKAAAKEYVTIVRSLVGWTTTLLKPLGVSCWIETKGPK